MLFIASKSQSSNYIAQIKTRTHERTFPYLPFRFSAAKHPTEKLFIRPQNSRNKALFMPLTETPVEMAHRCFRYDSLCFVFDF